ncbi:MAG: kinase-regulated stress-responsive transcription factor skn7 [Caeruleum heppii]|nr:MAG: kinase-regulated stress-responsive transcription factor skn7 [Caeruleum heppii]
MDSSSQSGASANANGSSDFVRKLYKMLEDPSYDQVVRWGNDGDSFVVLENEKFTKSILPKHFKHSNFASFVRQLNKYDFHKVRHSNEETGQSPYGAGAWEFKHPEFKMNSKDSLENIRRKAPAPRKTIQPGEELIPTQQIDLVNTQIVAMQQQLQQLQDRYNELSVHHSMLLTEMIGMQKSVVNHEQVMQNVMSYLHSANHIISDYRRNSRVGAPFEANGAATSNGPDHSSMNQSSQQISPIDEPMPSPLQNAEKLLNDSSTDAMLNNRALEQMNEMYRQGNGMNSTSPPDTAGSLNGTAVSGHSGVNNAAEANQFGGYGRVNGDGPDAVYPPGHNNGIDPMFSEHINNIPYPMPTASDTDATNPRKKYSESRKKSTVIDPGWIRAPQILLVEDDPTCRRIGGKFLYSFKCAIDSAFDGLEAVNKMNAGSKYDLVLMDIIMPNLDGVSATSLIRRFDPTPIIAMTSNIRSDDISMYFQHGMNDVLPKPFTKEGLLNMLEKHLGHLKDPKLIDSMPPQQQMAPSSSRHSLKDETSPIKSPANSNWQSPGQLSGVSPTGSNLNEEYLHAFRGSAGSYGLDGSLPQEMAFHAPLTPMGGPRQGTGAHRRHISDISGSEDMSNEAKRQRVFSHPVSSPTSMPSMQHVHPPG